MADRTGSPRRRLWIAVASAATVLAIATAGFIYLQSGTPDEAAGSPIACETSKFTEPLAIAAVSPNGEYYAGTRTGTDGEAKALGLWHDGEVAAIDVPDGEFHEVVAVTDSGDVLGWDSYNNIGWRHVDGELEILEAPEGSTLAKPNAMNADGAVVGHTLDEASQLPLLWKPGAQQAKQLDLDGRDHGLAADITDDGTVVGRTGDGVPPDFGMEGDSSSDAWRWDSDGTGAKLFGIKVLPYAKGVRVEGNSDAIAITGDRILVTVDGDDQVRTRLSKPDRPEDVKLHAVAIDESGRAYGASKDEPAVHGEKVTRLPGLTAPPTPGADDPEDRHNTITAVSADGAVIAGKTWKDKQILWNCG